MAAWVAVILVATTVPFPSGLLETGRLPLDKLVHFSLYAVLGWTVARAVRAGGGGAGAEAMAWAAGLLFGAADELHQHFIPGRDPAVGDWVADAAGFTVAILASSMRARRGSGHPESKREGEREGEPGATQRRGETERDA